jgi:type IV pilus assembly protein PilO
VNLNFDLKSLDFSNIGGWPLPAKTGLVLILCLLVLVAGYYADIQEQQAILEQKKSQEATLKTDFQTKQGKAASLEAYRVQMTEMKESFGTMLRQLPNRNEVADLLVDISQTGLASGLEFELFQPKAEIPKEFFAELPITLKVTGSYHQMGEFVSGVAALPRIVTLHEIAVKPKAGGTKKKGEDIDRLEVQAIAKTYRYLDEEELAAAAAAARAKSKGKKGGK